MSAGASEPEKYSIDEMMDRLKTSSSGATGDGELVTRSDGSQVVRVRKRKRRTTQPHKEERIRSRKSRIVQFSAAFVLIVASVLAVGGAIIYANSSSFRDSLVNKIALSSGSTPELEQFRMNPQSANAGNLSFAWPAGNVLKSLSVHMLNAEVSPSSFFGKSFQGEEVTVDQGYLALQIPRPGEPRTVNPMPEGDLPIQFNRYRIPKFEVSLGDSITGPIRLLRSEASLSSKTISGLPQMRLYRGDFLISGWPNLRMDRALMEFRGSETDIISMRLLHEAGGPENDRGAAELAGTISPYQPEHASTLSVKLDAFLLSGVVGPSLGKLFSGRVDSTSTPRSNYLTFLPTATPSSVLDITFSATPSSNIEIQGFPFLPELALILGDDVWFKHPVFESDAGGVIHRENGIVTLKNLHFESKGRMAIRGSISMAPTQALSGNLNIGIADAMVTATSGSTGAKFKAMFGPSDGGFRWITLKIGGPATKPTDNFKELFTAAVAAQANPSELDNKSTFEELTRPK